MHINILGGGPSGLSAGLHARRSGLPFIIYEGSGRIGGNCVTFRQGDFLFDSGAHRLHGKDPDVTEMFRGLLGDDLRRIDVPSHIYHAGKMVAFPLTAGDLTRSLGLTTVARAGLEVIRARLKDHASYGNFEEFALRTYGRTIAGSFLLNYSEKLWGAPCSRLSPAISGRRLQGLDLRSFVSDAIFGRRDGAVHVEGAFYYPVHGIGTLAEKLAEVCGWENIRMNTAVTGIFHDGERITAVQLNGGDAERADRVVSTLPLEQFVGMLSPRPPEAVLRAAESVRYRDLMLVALFLDRPSVTPDATVYFPSGDFPFTRVYEPKNRSPLMAPEDKTSLVAEIPCQEGDPLWLESDSSVIRRVAEKLVSIGWIREAEVIGATVRRIRHAYPILEISGEAAVQEVFSYLDRFANLALAGRNGMFVYAWIHDMVRFGREAVERVAGRAVS